MADIVDAQTRSRLMAGIRGRDTRPEWLIRRALHKLGFRYRLHVKGLPGKPDLVFPGVRAVIFVHGCFWHGHDCRLFKWPKSREAFWREKISDNRSRDARAICLLKADGWRVATVWECALRGAHRDLGAVTERLAAWLKSDDQGIEITE